MTSNPVVNPVGGFRLWIVLFGFCAFESIAAGQYGLTQIYDKLLHDLENKTKYDSRIRPFIDEKPLEVTVSIYISSLNSISESSMDYKLELYFRELWRDPRLQYGKELFKNRSHIILHESLAKHIWLPDTFVPNAIRSSNPKDVSISHRSLLRLEPDGSILMSRRISITAECQMDLTLYPFDQQVCLLSIESYGHDIENMLYHWHPERAVIINKDLELPDFTIKKFETKVRNISLMTGTFSRLECCFYFRRNSGFYFFQLFVPATAIVVTSWILIWMESEATIGESIDIIIAMTFLYFSYTTMMPGVTLIKATDVFLGTCFLFVFLALIKLAVYKIREHHQKLRRPSTKRRVESNSIAVKDTNATMQQQQHEEDELNSNAKAGTRFLNRRGNGDASQNETKDKVSERGFLSKKMRTFIIFPGGFVIFCTTYLLSYLVIAQDRSQLKKCEF